MKEAFMAIGLIVAGLTGILFLVLLQNISTTDQHNFYMLEEVTEAALYDSVDLAYFRLTGDIRIYREKFVENFTRRWAESANAGKEYEIKIYDIVESPPKVSIYVKTTEVSLIKSNKESEYSNFYIENTIDMIIETTDYVKTIK